jgi:hypothetical protein
MSQDEWTARCERFYAASLCLYPIRFRTQFGAEMASVFRDCCEKEIQVRGVRGLPVLWLRIVKDLVLSATRERGRALLQRHDFQHPFLLLVDSILIPGIVCTNLLVLGAMLTLSLGIGPDRSPEMFIASVAICSVLLGGIGVVISSTLARLRPTVRLCIKL